MSLIRFDSLGKLQDLPLVIFNKLTRQTPYDFWKNLEDLKAGKTFNTYLLWVFQKRQYLPFVILGRTTIFWQTYNTCKLEKKILFRFPPFFGGVGTTRLTPLLHWVKPTRFPFLWTDKMRILGKIIVLTVIYFGTIRHHTPVIYFRVKRYMGIPLCYFQEIKLTWVIPCPRYIFWVNYKTHCEFVETTASLNPIVVLCM